MTLSVVRKKSKHLVEIAGNTVKVKWPQGIFDGTIIDKSGTVVLFLAV